MDARRYAIRWRAPSNRAGEHPKAGSVCRASAVRPETGILPGRSGHGRHRQRGETYPKLATYYVATKLGRATKLLRSDARAHLHYCDDSPILPDDHRCRVLPCGYGPTLSASDYPGDIGNDFIHCAHLLACRHIPLLAGLALLGGL